jgi:hypothetical protein
MVARLREKPGGAEIPVTIGDMADVVVDGRFSLIFVVANTFFCLPTQEEQVRCFHSVARHLAEGGAFLIQAFVPDLTRYPRGQNTQALRVEVDEVVLELSRHDTVEQTVVSQNLMLTERGPRFYPVQIRYAWPSELDLLAQLAGLRLQHRWGGWQREPFTASSTSHMSVYEFAAPDP